MAGQPNLEHTPVFLEEACDVGNITWLEHINLAVTEQGAAANFYFEILGLTRDPFDRVGTSNIWCNIGRQQIHLPTRATSQVLRGKIGLVIPDLDSLMERLQSRGKLLEGTRFGWRHSTSLNMQHKEVKTLEVTCPYGNVFEIFSCNDWEVVGDLGIPFIEFNCPRGVSDSIAAFYAHYFEAWTGSFRGEDGLKWIEVDVGPKKRLRFREKDETLPQYDGHHIAVYIAAFSKTYNKLKEDGIVWTNRSFKDRCETLSEALEHRQFRTLNIVDPETKKVVYTLEHEVRSMHHPSYYRTLVNRLGCTGIYCSQ